MRTEKYTHEIIDRETFASVATYDPGRDVPLCATPANMQDGVQYTFDEYTPVHWFARHGNELVVHWRDGHVTEFTLNSEQYAVEWKV